MFTTAGSAEKCAACTELGAEIAVNYREADYVDVLREAGGVDVSLNMVGGDYIARDLRILRDDGRLVMIAFLQGPKMELNMAPVMVRRISITGSTLRPQSVSAKTAIARALEDRVWPLLAAGRVAPVMDRTFTLDQAAQAHARMETSQHIGKIVLTV